jgi:hypothetical protein
LPTGIILFSAAVPVKDTLVVGNVIANNNGPQGGYGIWKTANVDASGLEQNQFINNGTNIFTQ